MSIDYSTLPRRMIVGRSTHEYKSTEVLSDHLTVKKLLNEDTNFDFSSTGKDKRPVQYGMVSVVRHSR